MSAFNTHTLSTRNDLRKTSRQRAAASCRGAEHLSNPLSSRIGKAVTVVTAQVSISLL